MVALRRHSSGPTSGSGVGGGNEVSPAHAEPPPLPADTVPALDEISAHHLTDETRLVGGLIERAVYTSDERRRTAEIARRLAEGVRANHHSFSGVDAFMREYGLTSDEGIIIMCLAEALLRIPDPETADAFLADQLGGGDWRRHLGHSDSVFVNASTWGLLLSGHMLKLGTARGPDPVSTLKRLVGRSGEPVIRNAVRQAVKVLSDQFVFGRTIGEAVERAQAYEGQGYRISYDMLGEEAMTAADAEIYFGRYMDALDTIAAAAGPLAVPFSDALLERPSISIKLSALHARFEGSKRGELRAILVPRVKMLLAKAKSLGIAVSIDAEEQARLEATLDVFALTFVDPEFSNWNGLGLAVQAYSKRAVPVLRWLRRLAHLHGKRIPVRLVKGAYWDGEIKLAQQQGLKDYPVFTRKLHTDVSYLAAMRFLLTDPDAFYPQFATHNAHTIAAAHTSAGHARFEYQRLHGMGEALYNNILGDDRVGRPCRIYAPVGGHDVLLSYLVRRLLENGANTSFVNRLADIEAPISQVIADPVERAERERCEATPIKALVRPRDVFWPERKNSTGLALSDATTRQGLLSEMDASLAQEFSVAPLIDGDVPKTTAPERWMQCPHDVGQRLGKARVATPDDVDTAIQSATKAQFAWNAAGGHARAKILDLAADLFERDHAALMAVLVREAGKTLDNAQGDVREAVDALRFYAAETRRLFQGPVALRSVTGETNHMRLSGRGVFGCISPWNFPVAIFTAQIAAALGAGNTVLAKPAPQTPLTGFLAVRLLHEAGVPGDVLQFLPGGSLVGAALVKDPRVNGIAFTGSNETAWNIQRLLADRRHAIVPLIAETGGMNAMIADSSALVEQVVRDAVHGAFDSAGQRCSATRVLFLQNDTADRVLKMLAGATEELEIGDPLNYATDLGPVIDVTAQDTIEAHKLKMKQTAKLLVDRALPAACRVGTYVAPAIFEIEAISQLQREVFGPVLHVVRYERGYLDDVLSAINATGYGLTLSVHSRIGAVADHVADVARVGNLYVNRNQIGAVPGVQPFGGLGLSGTGPMAGGPNYLLRFAAEQVRTDNSAAIGGNIRLLTHDLNDPD
jgi:RHH-type transcriptional regulator, proline utilization regulon repressor / proline dehydrogenase / delta 1-pyrroline-5-carboxylate dehydrogenase